MPRMLVVPGVSVVARYDVAPPLPARSGILGTVGVVDRVPRSGVTGVTSAQELLEVFGPATRFSFPEALSALTNGVSQVIVSPVDPRSGRAAEVTLRDDEGEDVVLLRARAVGPWGNDLAVRVERSLAPDRRTVRRVNVEVLYRGAVIERHENLILREGGDRDLFTVINRDSGAIVAIDPVNLTSLPGIDPDVVAFQDLGAQPALGRLTAAGAALVSIEARPGAAGNRISFEVREGRAVAVLNDTAGNPSVRVRAQEAGDAGTGISVRVTQDATGGRNFELRGVGGDVRNYTGLASVGDLVSALDADPDVIAEKAGDLLPEATPTRVPLARTVNVVLRIEGERTREFGDVASAQALVEAIRADGAAVATLSGDATALPDATPANAFYLSGGRDAGLARRYGGAEAPAETVMELVPAPGAATATLRLRLVRGTRDETVRLLVGHQGDAGFEPTEEWDGLTMDPDSDGYLPAVLQDSELVRAIDRYPRSRATHFPASTSQPLRLRDGDAPRLDAWQEAIDALALEDEVDLVIAGLQEWKDPDLDGVAVQQALLGHAITQADAGRPRIALGSIRPSANSDVNAILDHASQVANQRFVLVVPAGTEGAMAGLLGHLEYFESPTFKTVASPGAPLVPYTDSQLDKLLGGTGNACVIQSRRGQGTLCLKGIASNGFQISVTRVADRCIREVKAISGRFIGELNNSEKRNALKQMIVATFSQMARDGALVPSVDGRSPPFAVDVYASANDAAAGIVRVDIAVRPVRAIDYVYATIQVKN